MKKIFTYLVFLLSFLDAHKVFGQICATPGLDGSAPIGGQVNTYYPPAANTILTQGSTSLMLAAVPADVTFNGGVNTYKKGQIRVGDLLLIIQMQNATIESSNSNLYGAGVTNSGPDGLGGTGYTSLGNTGIFEYVVATSDVPTTGGMLTFRGAGTGGGVVNTYLNTDFNPASTTRGQRTFQVVRVPQYSNVKLIGTISAPPFNGSVGGIIAFDVSGTMNFNGQIVDGNARGFRAGFVYRQNSGSCGSGNVYVAPSDNTSYLTSGKGEGIVGSPKNMWDGFVQVINTLEGMPGGSFGRGAAGNAGGGGNSHNAGGGGGGNGGFGGRGGTGAGCSADPTNVGYGGGRPGSAAGIPVPSRLIMGGGGGAGEVNNAQRGTSGGVGGGIILINVGSITGTGTITSNGGAGQNAGWDGDVVNDGAGGGGAGGTVYIKVSSASPGASLTINTRGGAGGKAATEGDEHGPGGGGGGGVVFYSSVITGQVNTSVLGGVVGTTTNGTSVHGATAGQVGQALSFTIASLPTYLQGGGIICFPELTTTLTEVQAGAAGARMPGAPITYTLTVSNKVGVGGAAGVIAELSLPTGITYQSVSISYTGGTGGDAAASVTINQGTVVKPRFGNFVVAPGGSVILTVYAKVDCSAAIGITYTTSAQVYYYDPTRDVEPLRRITPSPTVYTPPVALTVSTNYESGGGAVPGANFNGATSTADDVEVVGGSPVLSSSLNPAPIQSSSLFSYTPTSNFVFPAGGGVLTYRWLRSAIAGISNPTQSMVGAISEVLINTTNAPITVTYGFTPYVNGCSLLNSQTVQVLVNPSVLTISADPNPVAAGNAVTISVSLPPGVFAANNITLALSKTGSSTAQAGTHYDINSLPPSVTIPQGQNSTFFFLSTLVSNVVGLSPTLGLTATLADYTITGITVTIVSSSANSVLTTSSGTVIEGQSISLSVSLPNGITTNGPLTLAINRIPAFPGGYTVTPATVVIPAGTRSITFTVNTANDGNVGDNTFTIVATATGYSAVSGTLMVTDINHLNGVSVTISSASVSESLSQVLMASLPTGVRTNTPLTVTLTHTAFPNGYIIPPNVIIQAGQNSATFIVQTADDGNIGNRVFSISGTTGLANYVVLAGTLTVIDSSPMTITVSSGTITESFSGLFRVSLPANVNTTTALIIQLGHSPFPVGAGYIMQSNIIIQAGQNSATFLINTERDGNVGNNTFNLTATTTGSNFIMVPGILIVEDVDVRGGFGGSSSTTLTIGAGSVTESLSQTLTVSLPGGVRTNTPLTVTIGHGAFPAVGYAMSSTAVIPAGNNTGFFVVQTARDFNVGDNTLAITGTVRVGGSIRAGDYQVIGAILTISDVDAQGGVNGVSVTTLTISSGKVSETLSTSVDISLPLGVITNTPLTVMLGHDVFPAIGYNLPLSVTIPGGQNSTSFLLQTASDGNVENNILNITGTAIPPHFIVGSGSWTIEDVDVRGGLYGFDVTGITIESGSVLEGSAVSLTISLPQNINTNQPLTITLGHSPFPAIGYSMPSSAVIPAGQNFVSILVQTVSDGQAGDSVLSITGTVSSNMIDYVVNMGSLTIINTNPATVTISSGSVSETQLKTLILSLPLGVLTKSDLPITLAHSTFPTMGYSMPSSVIIAAGANSASFDIQTDNDGNIGDNTINITGVTGIGSITVVAGTLTVEDVDVRGGLTGGSSTTLIISSGSVSETQLINLVVSLPNNVRTNTPLVVNLGHSPFPTGSYSMPSSVVILAGANSASFSIQTAGDGNVGNNVFSITGSVSTPDIYVAIGTLTVIDTGTTTLIISSGSVSETQIGTLRVSLPNGINANANLTVNLGHSLFPNGSYSMPSSVVIQAGQNSATFDIQTASDGNVGDNTFSITGTVVGASFGVTSGILVVNDVDVRGGFSGNSSTTLTIQSLSIMEGATAILSVSLPASVNTNVPLGFTIQASPVFPAGYKLNGGSVAGQASFSLVIPAGGHSASYTLVTVLDGLIPDVVLHLNGVPLSDYYFATGNITVVNVDAPRTPILTITSGNTISLGRSLTASVTTTATLSSGGQVTYSLSPTGAGSATIDPITHLITGLRVGTVLLIANTLGDTNYSAASATQTINITKGTPMLLVGAPTNTLRVGEFMSITATSTSSVAGISSTGAITYRILNTTGTGGATIDRNTGLLEARSVGMVYVEVSQASDDNFNAPVPSTISVTVNKGSQTLSVESIDIMNVMGSIAVAARSTATTGRGGTLSYNIVNGSANASIDANGIITASGPGTATLMVDISGDGDYLAASTSQLITIVSLNMSLASAMHEGEAGMITLSLNPANITLPRAVSFTLSGQALTSGRFSASSTVLLPSGQTSINIPILAKSDLILYNDASLDLSLSSIYIGTVSGSLMIIDGTSLISGNRVLTIDDGTIFYNGSITLNVSLPEGVTTAQPISVTFNIGSGSTLSLLGSPPTLSPSAVIRPGENSATLKVGASNSNEAEATLIIEGNSVSATSVKSGTVKVVNKKIDFKVMVSINGDGVNDCMTIQGIENYPNNTVRVVSRTGNRVYEKSSYDLSTDCFDGHSNQEGYTGVKLADGIYYYIIIIRYPNANGELTEEVFKGPLKIKSP